ncbi:helix-turn-helix domain-containing protein [Undibacterium danionis]|uniref:Helix-turn-helix domain-containing protein n=1 Tax=Undibacterium danionis TaxID=1812100 RepID=A0ABV6I9D5_9BURK
MNDLSRASTLLESNDATESIEVMQNLSVGERLSSSRGQKGWSVQYVAEQLKLSQGQILALESNQFELLPKLVIVRGFVRAYAKLLKIDADSLIALLPKDASPMQLETSLRPALSTPFVDSRLSLLGHHDNNRRYIVGAICLVLLVGIFLLVQRTEFGRNLIAQFHAPAAQSVTPEVAPNQNVVDTEIASATASVAAANANLPRSDNVAMPSLPSVEPVAAPTVSADEQRVVAGETQENLAAAVTAARTPVVAASSADVTQLANPNSAQAASKAALSAAAGDNNVLVLKFRENSWIQVKTETGTVLSSRLAKAGTEESFSVKQALSVRIGNAAGVDASLRGQTLTISSERGSNVANLVVK